MRRRTKKQVKQEILGPETGADIGRKLVMTRAVREAVIEAAERIGSDGKGKDGLIGFMIGMAKKRPENFDSMLLRMVPIMEGVSRGDEEIRQYKTVEEVRRAMRERALPVPASLMEGTPTVHDDARALREVEAEEKDDDDVDDDIARRR